MISTSQQIKGHETHIATLTIPLLKHRLYPFVAIASAGLTVRYGGLDGPSKITEPRHPGMAEQITPRTAVAGYDPALADVNLSPLPIELGLGDVAAFGEPFKAFQAGAEHRGMNTD